MKSFQCVMPYLFDTRAVCYAPIKPFFHVFRNDSKIMIETSFNQGTNKMSKSVRIKSKIKITPICYVWNICCVSYAPRHFGYYSRIDFQYVSIVARNWRKKNWKKCTETERRSSNKKEILSKLDFFCSYNRFHLMEL